MTKLTDAAITQVTTVDDTALIYAVDTTRAVNDQDVKIDKQDLRLDLSNYSGDWNATTNTPTLANTETGAKGLEYRVTTEGSVDFGAGAITFAVGDIVANDGSIWYKKVDNNQSGGGGTSYVDAVYVLDFFLNDSDRNDVINRNTSQTAATTTTAIEAAVQYAVDNDKRVIIFGDGLYITTRILFSNLDNLTLIGRGATLQYNANTSIFQLSNCDNVTIKGFHFTSILTTNTNVKFIRSESNNGFLRIHDNTFENFNRHAISVDSQTGGTFVEGVTISNNLFIDTPNYGSILQSAIRMEIDGEYSRIINNTFQNVPSAVTYIDGANGLFAFNTCMLMNGTAYTSTYDNAIIYNEFSANNSGKLDIIYNRINHNDTGMAAIVIKGDTTKPLNACKIEGNDILVHGSTTLSNAIYIKDAPYTTILNNKIRGNGASPNDDGVIIESSNGVIFDNNYLSEFDDGLSILTSTGVKLGDNIFTDIVSNDISLDGSSTTIFNTLETTLSNGNTTGEEGINVNPTTLNDISKGINFGDGDSGIYEFSDDLLIIEGGSTGMQLVGGSGNIIQHTNSSVGFRTRATHSTSFPMYGSRGDENTGIGFGGSDILYLIAGGAARATVTTTGFNISNLPTSSAGLSAGDLWNDSGTVKIV